MIVQESKCLVDAILVAHNRAEHVPTFKESQYPARPDGSPVSRAAEVGDVLITTSLHKWPRTACS